MASDEGTSNEGRSTSANPDTDCTTGERVYDAFVVRLWQQVGNPWWPRIEVEHAQSCEVAAARPAPRSLLGSAG